MLSKGNKPPKTTEKTTEKKQPFEKKERQMTEAQQQKQILKKIARAKEALQTLKSYIENKPKQEEVLRPFNIKCMFGNGGQMYCVDKDCNQPSVRCLKQDCQCHNNHRDCQTSKKISKVNEKMNLSQRWFNKVNLQFLEMEVYLIDMRRRIAQQLQKFDFTQQFVRMVEQDNKIHQTGLPYMTQDKKKSVIQLTAKKVNDYLDLCSREDYQIENKQLENLHKLYDTTEQKVNQHFQSIKQIVYKQLKVHYLGLEYSKIANRQKEIKQINQFLEQIQYRYMKRIFRGTVDGMSIEQFHSKCDNKPKLLYLVENEYGKKYGGYSPCPISIDRLQKYETDESMSSFVFSLDLNKKAKVIKKEHAILNGYKHESHQTLVGFGSKSLSLVIGSNSLTKAKINWILFYSADNNQSYQTLSNPPSVVEYIGASQVTCKLREVEVYQLFQ